jgi:integrase
LALVPLSAALRKAVKLGKLARDPAEHVTMPRLSRVERQVLTPEQAQKLLTACDADTRWGPLIAVLLMTGLRPGELCALRWSDLEGSTLRVQRALSHTADGWRMGEPKTRGSRRTIVLSEVEQRALERQRKRQAKQRLKAGAAWEENDLIFATRLGRSLDPWRTARVVLPRLLAKAELPRIRAYDLRHSHASLLLAAGVPVTDVSARLGHASAKMTLDVYAHALPGAQELAATTMARLVTAATATARDEAAG